MEGSGWTERVVAAGESDGGSGRRGMSADAGGAFSYVASVSFSPDGTKVASGSEDNTVKLWDVTSGECLQTLEGHSNDVTVCRFLQMGRRLRRGLKTRR